MQAAATEAENVDQTHKVNFRTDRTYIFRHLFQGCNTVINSSEIVAPVP